MLYKSLTIDVSQAKISEDSMAKATPNEQTLLNIFDNTKVVYNAMKGFSFLGRFGNHLCTL